MAALYVMTNPQLPPEVLSKAYVSPGAGEFAWKRADLPEAFCALVNLGYAILGGEVWVVEAPDRNWIGLVPSRDSSPPGVWAWDTLEQRADEAWRTYCERTLRESLEAVSKINVEEEAAQAVVPKLWFNVTSVGSNDV